MERDDLTEATLAAWGRLDEAGRSKFFGEFVAAALRLNQLDLRAWLRRRVRTYPLCPPLKGLSLSDDDIAYLRREAERRAAQQ